MPRASSSRGKAIIASSLNPVTLMAWAALWIAGPGNWPLWRAIAGLEELSPEAGLTFGLGLFAMIAASLVALMSVIGWRRTLKPAIVVLVLLAAVIAHFSGNYGVVIDPTMIDNVQGTDGAEVRDLLSVKLVLSIALLGALPAWVFARIPVDWARWPRGALRNLATLIAAFVVVITAGVVIYQDLSGTMRNHKSLRYLVSPFNGLYSVGRAAYDARHHSDGTLLPIATDARPLARVPGQRPPLLMLVIGETARADHFGLNGYPRDTTPRLAAFDVLSFKRVTSCGTNTATSLPCMLSSLGRQGFHDRKQEQENLLDVLQRAGLAVLWIENQAGCKGVCVRVPNTRPELPAPGATAPDASLCPSGSCYDEAMLWGLDARLAAMPADQRERGVVLVLHQMGSHGPAYASRSPPQRKPFNPECTSKVLQDCERSELVNSYDNSIAYTDHVLGEAIVWLQRQAGAYDPSLLYLSDHGESLGERGIYLHGLPFAVAPVEQTHVPMVAWLAPVTLAADKLDAACLGASLGRELTHDHLFHTVLGLSRVQTSAYRRDHDVMAACRGD